MRRGHWIITVAAALLMSAALVGCGAAAMPSPTDPGLEAGTPAPGVAPPDALPAVAGHGGEAPGVRPRPHQQRADPDEPAAEPAPSQSAEPARPTPTPTAAPTASAAPTPSPTTPAAPRALVDLLVDAGSLPPPTWTEGTWVELAPPASVPVGEAIPHVAVARTASPECAAAAGAVDGAASEAAMVALSAGSERGAVFNVTVLRYPSAAAAADAIAALQALSAACEGTATESGTFAAPPSAHGAAVALESDDAALVVDAAAVGRHVVAVLHERAPAEAVATLIAAQAERLR
ncbi:hypothetical protein [Agrococcus sp. Marseille-Q4369]|uniref:hypothetical protein n=1 Tax=Agrococcus sp. Marseille-Q4369 TaxID=2810513 RepID=UPI001B8B9934|nr:hypothetical protein [Agrococcus sp. Marseille-Q4369]QUW19399.1 hypothetical protein JSQ78_03485 [Agrococcus sp. Marseille-Q4369]